MKKTLIPLSVTAAVGGFVLRRLQLANSFDNAGLLAKNDGISIALYCLCAVAVALAALLCLREPKREVPVIAERMKVRGVLVVLAALGLLAAHMPPDFGGDIIALIALVLAFAAACAMAIEGVFHMQGQTGALLGGCVLPVYLALSLIVDYRAWSQDPMVVDYSFKLLFLVAAMLSSYHLAGFREGKGKRRITLFYTACALSFAGPVLADGGVRNILLTAAIALYLTVECWPYLPRPAAPEVEECLEEVSEPTE